MVPSIYGFDINLFITDIFKPFHQLNIIIAIVLICACDIPREGSSAQEGLHCRYSHYVINTGRMWAHCLVSFPIYIYKYNVKYF